MVRLIGGMICLKTIIKKLKLFIIICFVFILSSCSYIIPIVETEDISSPEYSHSREFVDSTCSSLGFGYGIASDDEYTALSYIYSLDELKKRYGDNFKVSDFGGSAEIESVLFFHKGRATYYAEIGNEEWTIKLSKELFNKWYVTEYYESTGRYIP